MELDALSALGPAVTNLDDEQSWGLVQYLRDLMLAGEHTVWRERLNGRWVVFLRHEEQTYCLLPLEFSRIPLPRP